MKRVFRLVRADGEETAVSVDITGDAASVEIGGRRFALELLPRADGTFVALFDDGRVMRSRVTPGKKETRLRTRGIETALHLFDPRDASSAGTESEGASEVAAAMPGRVLEVRVREGDRVAKGDLLLILEAMKMQNEIRAEADQVVAEILCAAGQAVEAGALLVRFASDRV
ncbi:MAG TPA: biotin/lipoyl-containing protein [Thermoanaerobaculia bacterium]|nr:biotin/lipoyl-containing protein [Thermoanaerobaculia bacterium]